MALLPPDPLLSLKSDIGHIHSLCFISKEPYVTYLLASSEKGFVYTWDLRTNRIVNKQNLGASIQVIHHYGEDKLITQEKQGVVKFWKIIQNMKYVFEKSYDCYGGFCRCIIIENSLILPKSESIVESIELETTSSVRQYVPEEANVGQIMCLTKINLNDAFYVLAGYESGMVVLWNFNTGEQCSSLKLHEGITSITYDDITRRAVAGNVSADLQLFIIDNDLTMSLKCEISIINEGCNVVKVRPNGKILVSGGWDGRVRIFSWKTLRTLAALTEHSQSITDIQFSTDVVSGCWNTLIIAISTSDGVISLWDLYK